MSSWLDRLYIISRSIALSCLLNIVQSLSSLFFGDLEWWCNQIYGFLLIFSVDLRFCDENLIVFKEFVYLYLYEWKIFHSIDFFFLDFVWYFCQSTFYTYCQSIYNLIDIVFSWNFSTFLPHQNRKNKC